MQKKDRGSDREREREEEKIAEKEKARIRGHEGNKKTIRDEGREEAKENNERGR